MTAYSFLFQRTPLQPSSKLSHAQIMELWTCSLLKAPQWISKKDRSTDTIQTSSQSQTRLVPQLSSQSLPHSQTPQYLSQSQQPCQIQPISQMISQHQSVSQVQVSLPVNSAVSHCQKSKSTSPDSLPSLPSSPHLSCSWARGVMRPPSVLLPRALYDIITASDSSGLPRCTSFLPHISVAWASSFR